MTRISLARLIGYSSGAFGTGVFSTVPTVLLLFFCTETLRIPPAMAGIVVFIPKAWAIVWDPAVGYWSDHAHSRIGRRRPFLLVGAIGVSAAFFALFTWPYSFGPAAFVPVAIIYFLLANAYSIFAVPFISIPAEISSEPSERERVASWRIGFAMVGVLIGASFAPILVQYGGGGLPGYFLMASVITVICGAGMASAFLATPSRLGGANELSGSISDAVRSLLKNFALQKLVASYILQLTGFGIVSALTPYWIVNVARQNEGYAGVALGTMLGATIVCTPLWALVIRQLGTRRAIAVAAVLLGISTSCFLILPAHPSTTALLILYAAIGVPFAGIQVGPFSEIAHIVHATADRTGMRQEGLFTGLWTAGEKLGLALGPGVAGLALAVIGFQSGKPVQSPETLKLLTVVAALAPALFLWASVAFLGKTRSDNASAERRVAGQEAT